MQQPDCGQIIFNYISLETALSDEGVISQIPINRITIMSTGRKIGNRL